jgi:hypothetical protein
VIELEHRPLEQVDIVERVLVALAAPRHRLAGADVVIPHRPGLYAIYGGPEEWADLGLGAPPDDRPLYVGKSESSLADRDLRTHFGNGRTGSSTVRRTFAALLHDELGLRGIPRNPARRERFANYGLSPEHDQALTNWMRTRLTLAVWANEAALELALVERIALREWQPPLNLKDVETPWSAMVREARRLMADEARANAAGAHELTSSIPATDKDAETPADRGRLGERGGQSTLDGIRPEALAREMGMSAKVLRAWLRRNFRRSSVEHWQPWYLTAEQAAAARAHFA